MRWWRRASREAGPEKRRGLNSLIILTAWHLWKHRNQVVFDGDAPRVSLLKQQIKEEAHRWAMVGARHLRQLIP
ncbi:hypothetical protein PR202_ga15715 [Eleusine coracana subsp. coracana]|uniref:Uncharacterized protein n=1 Tax=Eleusine coracana subsp. coracana TaxID=191504 RepID=A0AAV5CKD3_ELECO|nr:hypothetical protein PR202_ga15715 [Eleusine coracana subsp. coracana]